MMHYLTLRRIYESSPERNAALTSLKGLAMIDLINLAITCDLHGFIIAECGF